MFSTSTENFFGQIECQGKTYQAVNKCYTISVSFLPSGKTQRFSDSFVLFTAVLCLATWEELPIAGSAARGGEGVVEEPQALVLCLCAPKQIHPIGLPPLLLALWVPPPGFRKFQIRAV